MTGAVVASRRTIAEASTYDELVAGLRLRAEELNLSRATIDAVSGLQSGYAAKLLTLPPIRSLGHVSFGPLLQALGLRLALIEDPEALARVASQLVPRERVRANARRQKPAWLFTPSRAAEAAKNRWENVTAKARSRICRRAARARWAKRRASDAAGALQS